MINKEIIKRLQSEENLKFIRDKIIASRNRLIKTTKDNHPGHEDHEITEGEWKYFDAMFVSVDMQCSCGQTLKVTRDMT